MIISAVFIMDIRVANIASIINSAQLVGKTKLFIHFKHSVGKVIPHTNI